MIKCTTNPKCEIIDECDKKVDSTTAREQNDGLTRYVCGRIPCKYSNQVDHPSHYNTPGRKECIVEMEEQYGLGNTAIFCLMNAYKYLYRAGEKADNSQENDIAKARWYFNWVNEKIDCIDNLGYRGLMLYSDINKKLKLLKGDNEDEK